MSETKICCCTRERPALTGRRGKNNWRVFSFIVWADGSPSERLWRSALCGGMGGCVAHNFFSGDSHHRGLTRFSRWEWWSGKYYVFSRRTLWQSSRIDNLGGPSATFWTPSQSQVVDMKDEWLWRMDFWDIQEDRRGPPPAADFCHSSLPWPEAGNKWITEDHLLLWGKALLSGEFHPEHFLFHRPKRSPGIVTGGRWRWAVF